VDLLDLTPGSIFETITFTPERPAIESFLDTTRDSIMESLVFTKGALEGFPSSPVLALYFKDNQAIYWKLHRSLVGTPAGIDFVEKLWDYLKTHNSANQCSRFITVMLNGKPVLMGCMHQNGVRVGTRLTPVKIEDRRFIRAGETKIYLCEPDNCLCESVCVERIAVGN